MASTVGDEKAGSDEYQSEHMRLIFSQGLSFSGFERDHLSLNLEGKKFKDISGVSGIDSISDGRAAVLADFDNDGDLDIFLITIQGQGHLLFRNNVGNVNHFVRITVEGTSSGKDAFGSVLRLKTADGILTRIKSGGNGFLAQHDPRLLFGLGRAKQVEWVEVVWPSGQVQQFGPLKAGTSVKIVEGESHPRELAEKINRLPDPLSPEQANWQKLRVARGTPFPHLQLRSVQEDVSGISLKDGISYFINFWATWCGPCRKEMPHLQKLAPAFEAKGIELVGISLDQGLSVTEIAEFADKIGVSYPLYLINQGDILEIFGEEVFIPISILIDRSGRVAELFVGWSAESERKIRRLLDLK